MFQVCFNVAKLCWQCIALATQDAIASYSVHGDWLSSCHHLAWSKCYVSIRDGQYIDIIVYRDIESPW